jgi:hypothetical protein
MHYLCVVGFSVVVLAGFGAILTVFFPIYENIQDVGKRYDKSIVTYIPVSILLGTLIGLVISRIAVVAYTSPDSNTIGLTRIAECGTQIVRWYGFIILTFIGACYIMIIYLRPLLYTSCIMGWIPGLASWQPDVVKQYTIINREFKKNDASAVPELVTNLNRTDTDLEVRYRAAIALGVIGNTRGIAPLENCLLHCGNPKIRIQAALALGQIGNAISVRSLMSVLANDNGITEVDSFLSEKLEYDPGSINYLFQKIEYNTVKTNIAVRFVSVRSAVADALGKIKDKRAIDPLIAVINGREYEIARESAATALSLLGDQRVVPDLCKVIIQDKSPRVRASLSLALAELGNVSAAPCLMMSLGNDEDTIVRCVSAYALSVLGIEDAVESLIVNLESPETGQYYNTAMKTHLLDCSALALLRISNEKSVKAVLIASGRSDLPFHGSVYRELANKLPQSFNNQIRRHDRKNIPDQISKWYAENINRLTWDAENNKFIFCNGGQ